MMNDIHKIFGGVGMYEKLISQSNTMNSLVALSNPLNLSNWGHRSDENLVLKAITGNSLQLWQTLLNSPQVPENNIMSTFTGVSNLYNSTHKLNPILDSTLALFGKINRYSLDPNFMGLNQTNIWSQSLLGGNSAIEMLSKNYFQNDWRKQNNIWTNLIYPKSVNQKRNKKEETITNKIERFAGNVANVYSEVENFDEPQRNKLITNINEILTYEVQSTKDFPTYSFVLEWILNKYNSVIESALVARNVEALKKIHSDLKEITIVGWLAIIISTGAFGIIESKAGELWHSTMEREDVSTPNTHSVINFNAETNSSRPLLSEPDGRTKIICMIPDCTEVCLGEIVGKYVSVSFLYNGSIKRGWCLNQEFTKL